MAYSPFNKINLLNSNYSGTSSTFKKREASDGLDKRDGGGGGSMLPTLKNYTDSISKVLGTRSPYYTIGEITALDMNQWYTSFGLNAVGDAVRAVASVGESALSAFGLDKSYQAGVIIDGFGTSTGNIGVKFTENPVIFVGSSVSDGRCRTPNTLNMKVYVSNYYNDNGLGDLVDSLASPGKTFTDPALTTIAKNILLYGGKSRAQNALAKLRELQETGRPFVVYTPHGRYENMLIETISPVTNDKNVDMLECDITFKEMIMYEVYSDGTINTPARLNIGNTSYVKKASDWAVDKVKSFFK